MAVSDTMIDIFLSVSETHSFTKTAETLYITQQGVSKNIARLEASLGFPLFNRSTRSVVLTEAGRAMYDFLKAAKQDYLSLVESLNEKINHTSTVFRVGIMDRLVIDDYIARTMAMLRKVCPEVEIQWVHQPGMVLERMLEDDSLDMIIRFGSPDRFPSGGPDGSDQMHLHILDSKLVLLISANAPEACTSALPSDLEHYPLLLFRNVNSDSDRETEIADFRLRHQFANYHPETIRVMDSEADAQLAVTLCQGVTIGNQFSSMAMSPGFRQIPLDETNEIFCFWKSSNTKSALPYLLQSFRSAGNRNTHPDDLTSATDSLYGTDE